MTSKLPTRHAGHAKGMVLLGKRLARDIDAALTRHVNGNAAYVSCVGASQECLRLPGGFDEAVDVAESLGEVNLLMQVPCNARDASVLVYIACDIADRDCIRQSIPSFLEIENGGTSYFAYLVAGTAADVEVVRDLINSTAELNRTTDHIPIAIGRGMLTDASVSRLLSNDPPPFYTAAELFSRFRRLAATHIKDKAAEVLLSAIPGPIVLAGPKGGNRRMFTSAKSANDRLRCKQEPSTLWLGRHETAPSRGLVVRAESALVDQHVNFGDQPSFIVTSSRHSYFVHLLEGRDTDDGYIDALKNSWNSGPVRIQDFVPLPGADFHIASSALKRMRQHGLHQSPSAARFLTFWLTTRQDRKSSITSSQLEFGAAGNRQSSL